MRRLGAGWGAAKKKGGRILTNRTAANNNFFCWAHQSFAFDSDRVGIVQRSADCVCRLATDRDQHGNLAEQREELSGAIRAQQSAAN